MLTNTHLRLGLLVMLLLVTLACADQPEIAEQATLTPSPTLTSTSTATPTPTPIPTSTPTPTPVPPTPVPATVVAPVTSETGLLTLADLPPGFIEIPLETEGLSQEVPFLGTLSPEETFVFSNDTATVVLGGTLPLASPLERAAFDTVVTNPNLVLSGLGGGTVPDFEISRQETLSGLDGVGAAAAGFSMDVESGGLSTAVDMVLFRRGSVGAVVAVLYPVGGSAVLDVVGLASLVDGRVDE